MVGTKGFPPPTPPDLAALVDQESCQRLRCTRQVAGDPVVGGRGDPRTSRCIHPCSHCL